MPKDKGPKKAPRLLPPLGPGSTLNRVPQWDFSGLHAEWGIKALDASHRAALASQLEMWSQLTWGQVIQAPKQGLGSEKLAFSAIRSSWHQHGTPPPEDVLVLRFGSDGRAVGLRHERVFHLLWVDHRYRLYRHGA